MSFQDVGIEDKWCEALRRTGVTEPTAIQREAIPPIAAGRDVVAEAPTGSGKTLAYLLPILQRIEIDSKQLQAIVIVPTRELGMQILHVAETLIAAAGSEVRVLSLIGGAALSRQIEKLKEHPHLIVGTPGRIAELLGTRKLTMHHVRTAVVDEADQVLALGSAQDVDRVLRGMQRTRQLLYFSATITGDTKRSAAALMREPLTISASAGRRTAPGIEHAYVLCEARNKIDTLRRLVHACKPKRAIVFANATADVPDLLAKLQHVGLSVSALHGDAGKADRSQTLQAFRAGKFELLLATDVAARGLDIEDVTHIFHLDMASNDEAYVHRVGRTGRMGRSGTSVSIVSPRELWIAEKIAKQLGIELSRKDVYGGKLVDYSAGRAKADKQRKPQTASQESRKVAARDVRPAVEHAGKPASGRNGSSAAKPAQPSRRDSKADKKANAKDKGAPKWLKAKREQDGLQ